MRDPPEPINSIQKLRSQDIDKPNIYYKEYKSNRRSEAAQMSQNDNICNITIVEQKIDKADQKAMPR